MELLPLWQVMFYHEMVMCQYLLNQASIYLSLHLFILYPLTCYGSFRLESTVY